MNGLCYLITLQIHLKSFKVRQSSTVMHRLHVCLVGYRPGVSSLLHPHFLAGRLLSSTCENSPALNFLSLLWVGSCLLLYLLHVAGRRAKFWLEWKPQPILRRLPRVPNELGGRFGLNTKSRFYMKISKWLAAWKTQSRCLCKSFIFRQYSYFQDNVAISRAIESQWDTVNTVNI